MELQEEMGDNGLECQGVGCREMRVALASSGSRTDRAEGASSSAGSGASRFGQEKQGGAQSAGQEAKHQGNPGGDRGQHCALAVGADSESNQEGGDQGPGAAVYDLEGCCGDRECLLSQPELRKVTSRMASGVTSLGGLRERRATDGAEDLVDGRRGYCGRRRR
eukprot:2471120-Pyramimonas_sp.AAC.1